MKKLVALAHILKASCARSHYQGMCMLRFCKDLRTKPGTGVMSSNVLGSLLVAGGS